MKCTFSELRCREVINTENGARIGYIDDVEIDSESGKVISLIICGRPRMFGLLGKDEDVVISCSDIVRIGSDTVLVSMKQSDLCKMHKSDTENLFQ